ncbi:Di-and tricarboxylate transporter [Nitrosomonas cryotolerans]|uniref:Di-and tricarboxylate transporter n=1 Tax=Nitrosomonas cryotolerans ATCC 49181 TaxID=1131553 RepID=A0A1N6IIE3_9PROT|nr:SLC13 family permease [Nitrosomonas cryotolerans]SFP89937.1 Di-and tricarboxylate transporter [Nitrosomonas cryotolerans]SIO31761.1 Di-and tricarboxylate transporter [Nitrosomonas cryotolerans ATCC 49181]
MNVDQITIFLLLVCVMGLFIWGRWRYDLVAFAALIAAVLLGLVPPADAFLGFSNSAVITVAAVLVISRGLSASGAIDRLAHVMIPKVQSLALQISGLSGFAAVLSAIMNNVGALALLMPATIDAAKKAKRSPSLLLMPLSFGSILGGLVTLIGTPPNIIIASYRETVIGTPYQMFDFAPVGLVVATAGILFLAIFGWKLIPKERQSISPIDELLNIDAYVAEVVVPKTSAAIGKKVIDLDDIADKYDLCIAGLIRNNKRILRPTRHTIIEAKDILILETGPKELDKFVEKLGLMIKGGTEKSRALFSSDEVLLIEAVVSADSRLIGRVIGNLRFKSHYGLNLLGISRQGKTIRTRLHKLVFRSGDVLLLQVDEEVISTSLPHLGLLPLAWRGLQIGKRRHAWLATGFMFGAVVLAAAGIMSLTISLSLAALLMVLSGIVPTRDLYESIDWPVIVLVGAMIPVGGALETTGSTTLIANAILQLADGWSPIVVLSALFIVTMTLSDVMNNAATAVVMAPVGINIAIQLHVSPDPFLMAVAVGSSCAFLTPIGHKNNALIMGPGGYAFGDYWRMGLPLEIIVTLVSIPMILIVWPL